MTVLLLLIVCFASMHNITSISINAKPGEIDFHEMSHLDYSDPFLVVLEKDDGHPYFKFYSRFFKQLSQSLEPLMNDDHTSFEIDKELIRVYALNENIENSKIKKKV